MSLFSAFGQRGFAVLAQTFEDIGTMVAPLPEENENGQRINDTGDERSIIRGDEDANENRPHQYCGTNIYPHESEFNPPESPDRSTQHLPSEISESDQSFMTVELGSDSNAETPIAAAADGGMSPPSVPLSSATVLPSYLPPKSLQLPEITQQSPDSMTLLPKPIDEEEYHRPQFKTKGKATNSRKVDSTPPFTINSAELEKRVQQQYRNSLERSISSYQLKIDDLTLKHQNSERIWRDRLKSLEAAASMREKGERSFAHRGGNNSTGDNTGGRLENTPFISCDAVRAEYAELYAKEARYRQSLEVELETFHVGNKSLLAKNADLLTSNEQLSESLTQLTVEMNQLRRQSAAMEELISNERAAHARENENRAVTENAAAIAVEQQQGALFQNTRNLPDSEGSGVEEAQIHSVQALRDELAECKAEMHRLNTALLESEQAHKQLEEITWKAKSEGSELLHALQVEQGKLKDAEKLVDTVRELLTAREQEVASIKAQLESTKEAAVTAAAAETEAITRQQDDAECVSHTSMVIAEQVKTILDLREDASKAASGHAAEIDRLNKALLESEETHKQLEEMVWKAKAEASELLFALQQEERKREDADRMLVSIRESLAEKEQALSSMASMSVQQMRTEREAAESAKAVALEEQERILSVSKEDYRAKVRILEGEHRRVEEAMLARLEQAEEAMREAAKETEEIKNNHREDCRRLEEQHRARMQELEASMAAQRREYSAEKEKEKQEREGALLLRDMERQEQHELEKEEATNEIRRLQDQIVDMQQRLVSQQKQKQQQQQQQHLQQEKQKDMFESSLSRNGAHAEHAWDAPSMKKVLSEKEEELIALRQAVAAAASREKMLLDAFKSSSEQQEQQQQQQQQRLEQPTTQHESSNERLDEAASAAKEAAESKISELQAELASVQSEREREIGERERERRQYEQALTRATAELKEADQTRSLKQQLSKAETENKQLHQVITQLRQVRKATKGETDSVFAERDELKAQVEKLTAEVQRLQKQLAQQSKELLQVSSDKAAAELAEAQARLRRVEAEMQARVKRVEERYEEASRIGAQLEKECYEKEAQLERARSDGLLAQQDLAQRVVEVNNLKDALQQVAAEKVKEGARMQRRCDLLMQEHKEQMEVEMEQLKAELAQRLRDEETRRQTAEQSADEQALFRRKAELDLVNEKKRMQRTLEQALAQLKNSQQDVVDRALIANLIVTYFQKRRSLEVLDLIARVLQFDEDQLVAVGLRVAPLNFLSLSSIIQTVLGDPAPQPDPSAVESDNLAELWINFLINQADNPAPAKPTPPDFLGSRSLSRSTSSGEDIPLSKNNNNNNNNNNSNRSAEADSTT